MQAIEQILDSREVAGMIEKDHSKLLRDIRTYIEQLAEAKIGSGDFFRESTYLDTNNQRRPCFNVTRKGCEFIANKLTGTKGVRFTARYINRFHEMESLLSEQKPAVAPVQPDQMKQIKKEYAELKKEISVIKSDLKRIGRNGSTQIIAYSGSSQYKDWIFKMLNMINESEDGVFLHQICTILKKHLERKNNLQWMA